VASVDKSLLVTKIRSAVQDEHANAERVARDTAAAANHPEAKPENDKDTRKIELSYLAAGQAARAKELEGALAVLSAFRPRDFEDDEPLQTGAVATLDVDGKVQRVFLSPAGGGMKLEDGGELSVVTPQSPLGGALLGKVVGESFELVVAGRSKEVTILSAE
jgi:transcription elongation GreA/GreB family factor